MTVRSGANAGAIGPSWPLTIQQQAGPINAAVTLYHVPLQVFMGMYNNETILGTLRAGDSSLLVSPTGAEGPFQFEPSTATSYNYPLTSAPNLTEFGQQATAAAHYLSDLYHQLHSWQNALAGYNGGAGNYKGAAEQNYATAALAFQIPADWAKALNSPANAGGVAGQGGTGTNVNDTGITGSGFTVGDSANPDEDYWTAINRLCQSRYWYCFALALDTPIPTPHSWTTMEALVEGDEVLGSDDRPIRVTGVSPTFTNRECFRVEFLDRSSIVADGDHRWKTLSLGSGFAGEPLIGKSLLPKVGNRYLGIRTTRQIASHVKTRSNKYNHRIGSAQLALPEVELPIDPYIFGYWLGDGSKTQPRITVGEKDHDHLITQLRAAGLTITNDRRNSTWFDVFFSNGNSGDISRFLCELDVHNNKHIPSVYLRASRQQRIALLQGLMDSDGSPGINNGFSSIRRRLADDFYELLATLGIRGFRRTAAGGRAIKMPAGHTSIAKDLHGISFAPTPLVSAYRLPRKLVIYEKRLRELEGATQRGNQHTITCVAQVPSVPVRCITVSAEDGLFLAGEAMVPTHNSDSETLYIADGPDLMLQRPATGDKPLDRIADLAAINHLSYTWDNCIALDTPIPTPDGETTMGELEPGDYVLGASGEPTEVLHTSRVHVGRDCYRLTFDDGTSIVSDEGHFWETTVDGVTDIRSTGEILTQGGKHTIRPVPSLELPTRTITEIVRVPSVPVRCITVAAEDHLFLAGEGMVPTRNTAWQYAVTHRRRRRIQRRSSLAKVISPVEGTLEWICEIDEVRAGDTMVFSNTGPGDGSWLVGNVRRSLFEVLSEVTVVPALNPLSEQQVAGVNKSNTTFVPSGASKQYTNPVGSWSPSRIDQGVDGTLARDYVAPGDSQILIATASDSGWAGGGYIAGKLLNGTYAGKVWYVAEGVSPSVTAGTKVNAGSPVASTVSNPYNQINGNIETGWASPSSPGQPLAQTLSGYNGDQSPQAIACGLSFNRFIVSLGAAPGAVQGAGVGVAPAQLPGGYP